MKKISFILALMISAGLMMVSCSKVETPNAKTDQQTAINPGSTTSGNGLKCAAQWGANWLFDDEDVRCLPAPLDCYDVVTVKPSQKDILSLFEDAVNGEAKDVKVFFTTQDWMELFPGLEGTPELTKLQSGYYDMIMTTVDKSLYYYAAGKSDPLTLKNEEFVLRLDKSGLDD